MIRMSELHMLAAEEESFPSISTFPIHFQKSVPKSSLKRSITFEQNEQKSNEEAAVDLIHTDPEFHPLSVCDWESSPTVGCLIQNIPNYELLLGMAFDPRTYAETKKEIPVLSYRIHDYTVAKQKRVRQHNPKIMITHGHPATHLHIPFYRIEMKREQLRMGHRPIYSPQGTITFTRVRNKAKRKGFIATPRDVKLKTPAVVILVRSL